MSFYSPKLTKSGNCYVPRVYKIKYFQDTLYKQHPLISSLSQPPSFPLSWLPQNQRECPLISFTYTAHSMSRTDNPLKRRASISSDSAPDNTHHTSAPTPTPAVDMHKREYEAGRVICEICRKGVSFRDEESGGFTLKHWDAHRISWRVFFPSSFFFEFPVSLFSVQVVVALHRSLARRPSYTHLRVRRRLWLTPQRNVVARSVRRKNGSSTSGQTPTSRVSKRTAYFARRATSGFVFGPTRHIVLSPGMPTGRAAYREKCRFFLSLLSITSILNSFFFIADSNKNVYALEERTALFENDADVRKFVSRFFAERSSYSH